jgi:hypothetical protein
MDITYSSKLSDTSSPLTSCLSPSSSLAAQFSQSIAFSPTSSSDDYNSHLSRHIFLPHQIPAKITTVPLTSTSPTTNLIFSITSTQNHFDYFHHQQQRRDQQTIVETSNNPPSTNVLCR